MGAFAGVDEVDVEAFGGGRRSPSRRKEKSNPTSRS